MVGEIEEQGAEGVTSHRPHAVREHEPPGFSLEGEPQLPVCRNSHGLDDLWSPVTSFQNRTSFEVARRFSRSFRHSITYLPSIRRGNGAIPLLCAGGAVQGRDREGHEALCVYQLGDLVSVEGGVRGVVFHAPVLLNETDEAGIFHCFAAGGTSRLSAGASRGWVVGNGRRPSAGGREKKRGGSMPPLGSSG